MIAAFVSLAVLLAILAGYASRRAPGAAPQALRLAAENARALALRLPLALLAAGFLADLLPPRYILSWLGEDAGLQGIVVASAVGSLLPGGPMVAFPLAVVMFEAGVGYPQMIALITAWSVLAIHRVMVFELPLMGGGFVWRRLLISLPLPILAGLMASLALP